MSGESYRSPKRPCITLSPFLVSHHHEFSLSQHDKNCVHMHHLILENESFTMWNSICTVFWVFLLNWLSWNSFAVYSHIHNTPAVVILLWHSVSSGVPQGTSLGPLSFLPAPPPGLSERSPEEEFFFKFIFNKNNHRKNPKPIRELYTPTENMSYTPAASDIPCHSLAETIAPDMPNPSLQIHDR